MAFKQVPNRQLINAFIVSLQGIEVIEVIVVEKYDLSVLKSKQAVFVVIRDRYYVHFNILFGKNALERIYLEIRVC